MTFKTFQHFREIVNPRAYEFSIDMMDVRARRINNGQKVKTLRMMIEQAFFQGYLAASREKSTIIEEGINDNRDVRAIYSE